MKLLSIIQATRIQEGSNDSYYAYHDAAKKWAKDTGQPKEKFAYAGTDVQDKYIEPEMKKYGLVPDSYMGAGVTKYRREDVNEGEERSIIRDACIEKLVDMFLDSEDEFESIDALENAVYTELERLDVEDCIDPDTEHGGQRMGDFASGGVLDVIDSSSVIDDVMAQLDTSELEEGKSPHKKGSAKYKKHMAAMHAEAKDPRTSDADQIIKQIIDGYGIDNLEDVFRQYYPQLSDEQVNKFLKNYRKPQLKVVNNEDVDLNDGMIGEPDRYYNEEDRKQAYQELQDALEQCDRTEAQYVKDGICPNCAGSGYADADYEEEEDSCDGWGNYGCDEGEMTYSNEECSWVEIIKSDKRNADKKQAKDNYPGDEEVINQIRNMVMNMDDPRMAMQQMAIDYPHMGRRQRAELVSKGMKKAGLTGMGENMNENKWKEIETNSDYMLPVTMNNEPLDWPTYWEWEQSHGETNKNRASLRYSNYVADAKHELSMAEGEQHGNSKIYKKCWTGYSKVAGKKAGEKGSCKKNEGRIEDTFATDRIDKHDKPEKKKDKKQESIQVGDELMIETAEGEGIVVPVLHVVGENILVGWDNLAEEIVVEGAEQLAELRKLAGLGEAEYQGRKVKLNKPTRGDVKKFKVYVKDPKTGNVKKVNFGHGGSSVKGKAMSIKKSNPARRRSFRARHNCDNPGPRTKARYWSCRKW